MALTGKREYWDEIIQEVVPVASAEDAISGMSLRIPFYIEPPSTDLLWVMQAGDSIMSLFENEATELVFSAKLLVDPGNEGLQLLSFIRLVWEPAWGFLVGFLKTETIVNLLIMRFVNGTPEGLFSTPIGNEGRIRVRSDDDGALVRLQVEEDFEGHFLTQYFKSFDDMAPLVGNVNNVGFTVFSEGPVSADDVAILDNIQLDNQPVVPPEPIELPFFDSFEGETWEQ
jgi:hypothetical protein